MPSYIPARGRTLDVVGVCVKRIGTVYTSISNDKCFFDISHRLFSKNYYLKLFNKNVLDKTLIFSLTERINDNLHKNFGINNLYHRMIFTACALVAQRYSDNLVEGMNWPTLHMSILSTLKESYEVAEKLNNKLAIVAEQFSLIQCSYTENKNAINDFIRSIKSISVCINSDYWSGEDVMAIFFNEFTRYKGKSEQGQVFTPDHITSLIYRITGTTYNDNVLDACCGSGSFLVKAMSYMISEVGGVNNDKEVLEIKENRLYGIEFSKELYALACANMLIHKDGKTNLTQSDSRTEEACAWIKSKKITKVLMNPPYENAYGCLDIVENVLDNVEKEAVCAFIMPDTKLAIGQGVEWIKRVLNTHSLIKIIKLPNIFAGMASVSTSIFIFKAHVSQSGKDIFACWIKEDGLEAVKNKGRLDIHSKWHDIENKWVEIIYKQSGDESIQWINPSSQIMYRTPETEYQFSEKHFRAAVVEYFLHIGNHNDIVFKKDGPEIISNSYRVLQFIDGKSNCTVYPNADNQQWDKFKIADLFDQDRSGGVEQTQKSKEGDVNLVIAAKYNNGISSKKICSSNSPFEGNRLTLVKNGDGAAGLAFYQEKEFYAVSSIIVLKSKNNEFSRNHGLFISTMMKKFKEVFSHSRGINDTEFNKLEIDLPSVLDCNNAIIPDWAYIDRYIQSIIDDMNNKGVLPANPKG